MIVDGVYWDGDYSEPVPVGAPIWEQPFERDNNRYIYRQRYHQDKDSWSPLPLDSAGPNGGGLVEESKPQDLGSGILEFVRAFSTVPISRSEEEPFVMNWQLIEANIGFGTVINFAYNTVSFPSGSNLGELQIATTSRVQYDYFRTTNPQSIAILRAYKLTKIVDNAWAVIGSPGYSTINGVNQVVAEDSQVRPWKGNIYERATRWVPTPV